jgi:single-strand DNA-binding protein
MANVLVIQRHAHLAAPVKFEYVNGREGPVGKAVLVAISNTRRAGRGSVESRDEESTAVQWTLWGKQAENAAAYLGKGSHVNIIGRMRNNAYERDGETVFAMDFTAEEVDYLESRAQSEARRAQDKEAPAENQAREEPGKPEPAGRSRKPPRSGNTQS